MTRYDMRAKSRKLALCMCVAATTAVTGCMPQVLHGPRVDPGTSAQLNLSLGGNLPLNDDSFADEGVVFAPGFYFGARKGFTSGEGKPAFSIGAQVPLLGVLLIGDQDALRFLGATSYADVYVQPRWHETAGREAGFGVLASTALITPYFQYGHTRDNGNSWFTTQAVTFSHTASDNLRMWMPSVGWRSVSPERGRAVTFTAGGAVGKLDNRTIFLFLLSANAELGLHKVK